MKIFVIPTSYPNENNPVANIFIQEQVKALVNVGHEVYVLHLEKAPSKSVFKKISKSIETYDEITCVRYVKMIRTFAEDHFIVLNRNHFANEMIQLYYKVKEIVGKPNVVYAHFSCWAGYAACLIGKKENIPIVTMEHYSGFMREYINITKKNGLKIVVENSKKMLCVSDQLRDAVRRVTTSTKSIEVIPNMVDDMFCYCEPKEHTGVRFCAVGRLTEQKKYIMLLNAFCKAFSAKDEVSLSIGGEGEDRRILEGIISANGRDHQIHLLGLLSREETKELYEESDCFSLCSGWETFGIVWREAMAVGRPVITSNHGGWSNTEWSDNYGIMVPVENEEAIINAFRKMAASYRKYNGEMISKECLSRYSSASIARKIDSMLVEATLIQDKKDLQCP